MNDGGPAFPFERPYTLSEQQGLSLMRKVSPEERVCCTGMSLRDYFAAAALQGLISNPSLSAAIKESAAANGNTITDWCSGASYEYADAMLKQREAKRDNK